MVINPTPRRLEVTFQGAKKEIFMSYGLLSRLTNIIGGPNEWPQVATDMGRQEAILQECLCVRNSTSGEIEKPVLLDQIDLDLDEIEKVLDWVGEHVMSFFTVRVQKSLDQVNQSNKKLEKYQPTNPGSSGSPSSTPAA